MLDDKFHLAQEPGHEEIDDLSATQPRRQPGKSARIRALLLVNLSAGLDGCDDQMLPASFRALESELHFTPKMLGHITMIQSLTQSLCCPIWGYLSDRTSRKLVLGCGCFMWGVVTLMLATADLYEDVILLRALNGAFMAVIGPVSQTVLADYTSESTRGLTFGLIQFTANGGRIIGGVLITSLGTQILFDGISGWRFLIACLGLVSIFVGLLILVFMPSTQKNHHVSALTQEEQDLINLYHRQRVGDVSTPGGLERNDPSGRLRAEDVSNTEFLQETINLSLSRPTVFLIILEGFLGSIPWNALSFATMFYQYCGLSDLAAGLTSGCMLIGGMIGGPLGGYCGDVLSKRWSIGHGRPLMAQISMACRIPILYGMFVILPKILNNNMHLWKEHEGISGGSLSSKVLSSAPTIPLQVFMALSFCLGLCSFAGVAVNRPILSDVVLPEHRATAFAIAIAIEGVCSAFFGAPLVGHLAEHRFGYRHTNLLVKDMSVEHRVRNASALARSIAIVTIIPWLVSFFIYTLTHLTLEKDLSANRQLARSRSIRRANIPGLSSQMRSGSITRFLEGQTRT